MAIQFETEWVDAAGVDGPELSATWASLRIRVDEAVITRLVDRSDTVRSQVYVPLYPLVESLVTNWWFLLHEIENPAKSSDQGFERRHALVSARDGYAFPNLQVMPAGGQIHLTWMPDRLQWSQIEFLEQGQAWIDREEFRECCSDLVQRVVKRLASLGVEGTILQEEWASIQAADEDEVTFCETAAGLGWDPYAISDTERTLVSKLEENLTQDWFREALAVLDGERLDAQVAAIAAVLKPRKGGSLALNCLRSIARPSSTETGWRTEKPWAAGYALARHVRQELALDGIPLPTAPALARALNEDPQALRGATKARDFGAADLVNGAVTQDNDGLPAFAIRSGSDSARRFHFCRGLAEVLAAPNSDALLTQARSDRQQWSRAFAAEFLAPAAALQAKVSGSTLDEDAVDELASEFGVSPWLIAHQVQNHGIAEVRQ